MITTLALSLALLQGPKTAALTVKLAGIAQGVRALAFAPSPTGSRFVATMENNTFCIIDAANHMTLRQWPALPAPAYAVAWSKNGRYIATGDESARVTLWDAETGRKIQTFRDHQRGIQALSFNASSTMLLSTGKDDAMNVYSVAPGKKMRTILGRGINLYGGLFMGGSSNILVGTLGKGAAIYRVDGQPILALGGHGGQGVFEAAVNPAQTLIVSAGKDGGTTVWNGKTKKKLNSLKGHSDFVIHVLFSPNGKYVATSSSDGTVRVWDPANFRQVAMLPNETSVGSPLCFTADGKYLLSVSSSDYLQYNTLYPSQPLKGAKPATHRRRHRR